MPQDYYSLVTNQGLIKEAASNEPGGTAIDLTEMAVGDSNGTYYDPDGSETALANEVHRVNLTHVVVDENNTNQLIVEAVLDETIGPFYIREVGIFDSNGDLFAIGKYPETFKPNLPAGSGKRLYIRMILGFANSPNVNLVINNDIALDPNFGTDVNNALAERLIKTNNLSDLDNVATARVNLGLGSSAINDTGNLEGEIPLVEVDDKLNESIIPKILKDTKIFTASGSWTKPAGISSIKVLVIGAGGGGAGSNGNTGGGGAGGGGAIKTIDAASLGTTETITIGTGGTGGSAGSNIGTSGGTTSFGSHCSATGGGGGHWNGTAGGGGIGISGDLNSSGSSGSGGSSVNAISGGSGGASAFGYGGGGPGTQSSGSNGQIYGGGGAGATNNTAGGNGADGIIIVWEYN